VPGTALTKAEKRLRILLYVNVGLSLAFVVYYLASGAWDSAEVRFVVNSTAKDGLFIVISLLAAADVRRRGWLALVQAAAYAFLILAEAWMMALGDHADVSSFGTTTPYWAFIGPWMAIDAVILALLVVFWWQAEASRLRYLNPIAFRSLIALADVLIEGDAEAMPPRAVALNVDRYLAELEAEAKGEVQTALFALALAPLLSLRPPLPAMGPRARKRYLKRRFIEDVAEKRWPRFLLPDLQAAIRVASQMAYLGYYGDRRSWPSVGYRPFPERHPNRIPDPLPSEGRLTVLDSPPVAAYDTIVVGSGAGGGILAYRLARAGRRVLVVERGRHYPSKDFDMSDEVGQYLRLYSQGALQLSTDFRLQVLQGICVGGSTTVNNAVCIDPPDGVLAEWKQRGIPVDELKRAIADVRHWLPIVQMDEQKVSTKAALRFKQGLEALRVEGKLGVVDANIRRTCLGCGDCNIGCAYGQKLSSLDCMLPRAQKVREGKVDVLPELKVEQILRAGRRATGVRGRTRKGDALTLEAGEVVVAAGAMASSWLLQRSGIGGDRPGAQVHFNVNSPLTAEFPEIVDAFDGLQMSHAFEPAGDVPPFVIETWFNPPATQALAMPGWFEDHFENMRRYRRMACAGVLTGTTVPGSVTSEGDEPAIHYEPAAQDLRRIVEGLKLLGRAYLAAGATRVMPATFEYHQFRTDAEMATLDRYVQDNADILLTTAHPQGGNPIGPEAEGGVVDRDFHVHGFDNLYVADASVFPSSVTVNPQMTVFGLAWLAADRITGELGGRELRAA
jgi:choline dehydrogenase-like flavoprotein